ncbi:TonB-dependent receptor [bacterium]|nr:TonB-dependent receptor [candidate division CSSED10-310 bacterium]
MIFTFIIRQGSRSVSPLWVTLMLCLLASPSFAETPFTLKGTVIDAMTGQPIAGANVNSAAGRLAVTTDTGTFTLHIRGAEVIELTITHPGYTDLRDRFLCVSGTTAAVTLALNPMPTYSAEVVVTEAPVPEIEPVQFVTPDYVIHAPGAFEDTLQSLQVMPGVVGGDDYSARLFIRGGRPDQNGIFLDNIPIYDPYRLFGLTSLFNPETIRQVKLIPGGFDVQYGDRLSAVIDVENRHGITAERFAGSANVSLTNTNIVAEGRLFERMPSSWLVSARRTYYDLIIKATDEDASSYPSFTDVQSILYVQPDPRNEWTVTLMACDEGTDLSEDDDSVEGADPDHVDLVDDQKNVIAGLTGSHLISDRFRWSYTLSFTRNEQVSDVLFAEGETAFTSTFDQNLTSDNLRAATLVEWYSDRHAVIAGIEAATSESGVAFNIETDDPRLDIPDDLLAFRETQDYRKLGAFVQDTWQLVSDLEWKAGIRWDESTLSGMSEWSPRTSFRWTPSDRWAVRAAWGYYYQFPSYEALQGDGYFLDLRGIKDRGLRPEKAVHTVVGMEYEHPHGWSLECDLYYKNLDDLIDSGEELETVLILTDDGGTSHYTRDSLTWDPENNRHGFARGADLTFKLHDTDDRPYYGMVTYTFSQAKTRRDGEPMHWESWDRRHSLTWVGGWKIDDRWELGWKWRIASGFPYTPVTRLIRVVDDRDGDGQYEPESGETFTWQRDDPESAVRSKRYPTYHRLDIRVQYQAENHWFDAMYYLDIINVYGARNIDSYDYNADYSQQEENEGMPFIPSLGVKLRF